MTRDVVSGMLERIDADLVKFLRLQFTDIGGQPTMWPFLFSRQKKR